MSPERPWRPRASVETLQARAALYARVRNYFSSVGVMEVETPVLSAAGTVDPNIDSFAVQRHLWLQTSPEFAMKRLLAAGSGAIYQIARVFRREEAGRHHNPEFTLLEWYRPGWDHWRLMQEVETLLLAIGSECWRHNTHFERVSYRQAFQRYAGIDPFEASEAELRARCEDATGGSPLGSRDSRDACLDLLMSHRVGPCLGSESPVFLYDFPASQAALARVRPGPTPVAERFELFWKGIELANGFHELTDAAEQRRRFEAERRRRLDEGRAAPPCDDSLLAALQHGLPTCAGVALGLDRLLMLLLDLPSVGDTLAFDFPRA